MHRRQFIQLGMAAAAAAATRRSALGRPLSSGGQSSDPAMLTIFLRGGNDALNTVIPYHDADYRNVRRNLAIPHNATHLLQGSSAASGTGIGLHPALSKLLARFDDPLAGRKVALLTRTGNPTGLRSHFTEQDIVETGLVDHDAGAPGWLPKLVHASTPYSSPTRVMSFAPRLTKMYETDETIPSAHFEAPYGAEDSLNERHINVDYGGDPRRALLRSGVADAFAAAPPAAGDHNVRQVGSDAIGAVDSMKSALPFFLHDADYDSIPSDSYLARRLEDAVQLMSNTETRFVGLEIGGFDTHNRQDSVGTTTHTNLLAKLDETLDLAYRKLEASFSNFLIVVVSEFGRTVEANGSDGTDHGVGGLTIALGPGVKGGLYNCHHPSWGMPAHLSYGRPWIPLDWSTNAYHDDPANNAPAQFRDALVPAVDFRTHFVEIGVKFLGLTPAQIGNAMGTDWGTIAARPLQNFLV